MRTYSACTDNYALDDAVFHDLMTGLQIKVVDKYLEVGISEGNAVSFISVIAPTNIYNADEVRPEIDETTEMMMTPAAGPEINVEYRNLSLWLAKHRAQRNIILLATSICKEHRVTGQPSCRIRKYDMKHHRVSLKYANRC